MFGALGISPEFSRKLLYMNIGNPLHVCLDPYTPPPLFHLPTYDKRYNMISHFPTIPFKAAPILQWPLGQLYRSTARPVPHFPWSFPPSASIHSIPAFSLLPPPPLFLPGLEASSTVVLVFHQPWRRTLPPQRGGHSSGSRIWVRGATEKSASLLNNSFPILYRI